MARSESVGAMASSTWWCPALIVCTYGFVSQLRPAESFLMPFLLSPDKNLTREQIANEVMPVLVYSYMAVLVPVFLLSDLLRYKPMLVLQSASLVAVWLLLLFTQGILGIQFVEFFYGVSMAARVAFSPILFALVETGHVQRVTSVSRAGPSSGLFSSSVLGQLCVTVWGVSYGTLNRVSLGFVSVSFLFSLFLPWPRRSLFFHRPPPGAAAVAAAGDGGDGDDGDDGRRPERGPLANGDAEPAGGGGSAAVSAEGRVGRAGGRRGRGRAAAATYLKWLRRAGRAVASSPSLCSWCAWWVFGMTGYYMVIYYVQLLWDEVEPSRDNPRVYNGATEAASTLLSALASLAVGFLRVRWAVWGELLLGVVVALEAALLYAMNVTRSIWLCYAAYVLFRTVHQLLLTVATFQIGKELTRECSALVFGVSTFLATVLQTIMTLVVCDKLGPLSLSVHDQFYVYCGYFVVLAVAFLCRAAFTFVRRRRSGKGADPFTSDLVASDLVTSDPVSPDPVSPDPINPDIITSDPITPKPIASDPIAPKPIASDPVTSDPVTSDPVAPDPVTPYPTTTVDPATS
uniref:LOW QUALITY PROTEIN: reduced folate transporter-like n=1 Tax=Petromyzon marinus TaxID=7757 RepID=A0AAJ7U1J4_PETMA|nr:LOW QUALITY PROTEIN: reduced folate transporter-like [Petromyzon marinus]